jgi:hypothetical protein
MIILYLIQAYSQDSKRIGLRQDRGRRRVFALGTFGRCLQARQRFCFTLDLMLR